MIATLRVASILARLFFASASSALAASLIRVLPPRAVTVAADWIKCLYRSPTAKLTNGVLHCRTGTTTIAYKLVCITKLYTQLYAYGRLAFFQTHPILSAENTLCDLKCHLVQDI